MSNLFDSNAVQLFDSDNVILSDSATETLVGANLQSDWDLLNLDQVSKDLDGVWDILNYDTVYADLQSYWGLGGILYKDLLSLWDIRIYEVPPEPIPRSKLEIIRLDQVLDISDEIHYVHEGNSGFGMPPLHRLSERGPLQDGVTDLGSRLDPRVIQFAVAILSSDWDDQYNRRTQLLNYLSPAYRQPVHIRFTYPDGITIRQLDCHPASGPIYDGGYETKRGMLKIGFSLIAPDPVWYDPLRIVQTIQAGGGSSQGFDQPLHVPIFFGQSAIDETTFINYGGTWSEFPVIEIYGQVENPVIVNLDTNEKLDFTGTLISPGDTFTIDLRYGQKTVVDNEGVNQIATLTADSDLTSFHLQPGFNNLHFTGVEVDAISKFIIRYYKRYLGV